MGKIKNKFTILTISLGILLILGSTAYANLLGTFNGNVSDYFSGKQGQLTIAITSDVKVGSSHVIGGTVALIGFSSCFTQGSFAAGTGEGLWQEVGYKGTIIAKGAGFSQAILLFDVSTDLTQILLHPSGSAFKDSEGDVCLFVNAAVLTKQGVTTTPTVSTTAVSAITSNTASSGGNVTLDGGADVTARGVCWSTSANPTTSDSKTSNGTGTGSFTSSITGLSSGTTYHVRAYTTNSAGTGYGADLSFTTKSSTTIPTVTTTAASSITATTASSGGNVTSEGSASVTARGVCWSTSSNPTVYDSHTYDGAGTGSFTSYITGLSPGTTYHVRAYAISSAGTGYGSDVPFRTSYSSTLYVSISEYCGDKTPCYDSIQEAIDAASTGSVILIIQGTYDESIVLNESKSLTLQGGWDSTFTTQSTTSTVNSITISNGTIAVDKLVIQ